MKGYKVLREDCENPGKFLSPRTWGRNVVMTYGKGMRTVPVENAGPLTVFTNLESAYHYKKKNCYYRVWSCEYGPSKETGVWTPDAVQISFIGMEYLRNLEYGTVLADWVELLEEIRVDENGI